MKCGKDVMIRHPLSGTDTCQMQCSEPATMASPHPIAILMSAQGVT